MKLAILGSSPIALEAALRFHLHGAALTWFNFEEVEYESLFHNSLKNGEYTSSLGLQVLREQGREYDLAEATDFTYWKDNYLGPLSAVIKDGHRVKPHEVVSINKRYLSLGEVPSSSSRFHDLFRIIFQVNPTEFIKEQQASNPETFERLTKELVDSLQTNLEMYEDFDLVVDLRRSTLTSSVSVTGRALGENKVSREQLKYGFDALKLGQKLNKHPEDVRELALIGAGSLSAEIVVGLFDWLRDPRSRLFVVSDESWPFKAYMEKAEASEAQRLKTVFEYMEVEFQKDVSDFHHKLREWQELDDFVQAKKPKPVEPIPRLVFFSGHNATAVDQLIDKRRLFLTLEKPEFREGLRHPENNQLELKTIGVDRILVANNLHKPKIEVSLEPLEVGFYTFALCLPNEKEYWSQDLEKLKGIEHEIFKLFSPAESH